MTPAPVRGALVKRLGELLREHLDDLADLVSLEVGKIRSEARGEVQEMVDICDFAVGLSRQLYGRTMPSERPGHRLMETWHPLGVVGVITAFNFPVAVWSWNTAVALVCGDTGGVEAVRADAADRAGLHGAAGPGRRRVGAPDGLAQLVLGDALVAERLVDNPLVPLVSATGSVRMGRAVGPRVAARFGRACWSWAATTPPSSPPSADLDLAARGIVFAAAGTAGQRCTTLRRLIVHDDVADHAARPVVAAYGRLPVGNPFDAGTLVGPLVNEKAYDALQTALATSAADGGEVLVGGDRRLADAGARTPTTSRPRRGASRPAGRRRTPGDLRADAVRAHLQRPRRGHRAAERRAAGAVVLASSPGTRREAERFHGRRRRRLRHRQRQHRHLRRRDRRGLRRREGDRRRPRVRLGLLEGLHAPRHQHRQLQRPAAARPGRRLHRLTVAVCQPKVLRSDRQSCRIRAAKR